MHVLKVIVAGWLILGGVAEAVSAELLMYRRAGCPYCITWDREVGHIYPKTDIGKQLPLRHVHLDRGGDKTIVLKSPVRFTPTFVLVENGEEKGRIEGYPGEFFFWGLLEKLLL